MHIVINGISMQVEKEKLYYGDICKMALGKIVPGLSITYNRGGDPLKPHGMVLQDGAPVTVQEGTSITAVFTGDA